MIEVKTRDEFSKACFKEGLRIRSPIQQMKSGDIFDVYIVGGMNTWKSLAVDAMIMGIIDQGNLSQLRNEMMFESNKTSAGGTSSVQDAQDKFLIKFFQVNGETICVAFSSSNECYEDHIFEERTMKQQIQEKCGLKDTDLKKLIIFQSIHDLEFYEHDPKKCPTRVVLQVECPQGRESNVRHLTFS